MDFGNRVNTESIQENDYSPMPEGWYQAQIIEESEKTTARNGVQLVYTFSILGKYEGNQLSGYQGRRVWNGYNVVCPGSPKAEEIAYTEIARLAKACGLVNVRDSGELVTKICDIRLTVVQEPGYNPKNEIKAYRAPAGQAVPSFGAQPQTQPQSQQGAALPPWERK